MRSITDIATMVNSKFVKPMATACNPSSPYRSRPVRKFVGVVENRVYAGKLVEHGERDGEKNREPVLV